MPIWLNLPRIGGRPRPAYFSGRCTPSVGKSERRFIACFMALLSMPSMVVSCPSLNIPRCVAWYLDFRSCSTASIFLGGLSLRLARVLASLLPS